MDRPSQQPLPTFDPLEWITLGEAAELLEFSSDPSPEFSRCRLLRQIPERPGTAAFIGEDVPILSRWRRQDGLVLLPDDCFWEIPDDIDWATSEIHAHSLLRGTKWQSLNSADSMLRVRVRRSQIAPAIRIYQGADRTPVHIAKQWRTARIARLKESQQKKREWINFSEIATWYSDYSSPIGPKDQAVTRAYKMLAEDLLDGDFEENGRSAVLCLRPWTTISRLIRNELRDLISNEPADTVHTHCLAYCWIRRIAFEQWLAKHELPRSPARFRAATTKSISNSGQPNPCAVQRRRRGPQGPRYAAADRALFPDMERIIRDESKSASAAALALAEAGKVKGAGSPENRAKRLTKRFLSERNRTENI